MRWKVPRAIIDNYAGDPIRPLDLADALEVSPGSSGFRMIIGASFAYGLTDGSYTSETIVLTELGKSIVSPTDESMETAGIKVAALKPSVLREFLAKYNKSKLPKENIAHNVLSGFSVPRDSVAAVYKLVLKEC